MTIDFLRPGLRLGYLIRGEYRDADGTAQVFRVCGPRETTGRSLALREPGSSAQAVLWEGRASGADFDEELGSLDQSIQALSDLTLTVELGRAGDDWSSGIREDSLRADAIYGWWANHKVEGWLFDVDDPDSWQTVFNGKWDRNPTSVRESGFSIVASGWILDPALLVPGTLIPQDESDWTDTSSPAGNNWWPNDYQLHPHLAGTFRGPVFGDASGETNFVWVELVPYGFRGASIYAHVSAQPNCYVHEVFFQSSQGEVVDVLTDVAGSVVYTFYNDDPARGPLGTGVQFSDDGTHTYAYNNDARDLRAWARVSGPNVGIDQHPTLGGNYRNNTGQPVRRTWEALEDLFEDPAYLGLSGAFGTNAIADFAAAAPMGFFSDWIYGLCAIPPEVVEESPELRRLLAGMLRPIGADLVQRWDPLAEDLRIYPIWRGPRPGQVAEVIRTGDLLVKAPPSVTLLDDPDGIYANRVRTTSPTYFAKPLGDPDHQIEVPFDFGVVRDDLVEQSPSRFAGVREGSVEWDLWLMRGSTGVGEAAAYIENERAQRQYVTEGRGNHRLMARQMGDLVRYEVPGVYDASGQVRARRLSLESMTVSLRAVHVEVHEDSGGRNRE